MSKNSRSDLKYDLERFIIGIVFFYVFCLIMLYISDKQAFTRWAVYGIFGVLFLIFLAVTWRQLRNLINGIKDLRYKKLLSQIKQSNFDSEISNFISSFGLGQDKSSKPWRYRNYTFDWHRINDFLGHMRTQDLDLNYKQFSAVLKYYIDERETERTIGGVRAVPQYLKNLSGADFERLLYRLFEKMDYTVQRVGKVGDQGGDLVIEKGIDRVLVQAKCYRDWQVGNDAI